MIKIFLKTRATNFKYSTSQFHKNTLKRGNYLTAEYKPRLFFYNWKVILYNALGRHLKLLSTTIISIECKTARIKNQFFFPDFNVIVKRTNISSFHSIKKKCWIEKKAFLISAWLFPEFLKFKFKQLIIFIAFQFIVEKILID